MNTDSVATELDIKIVSVDDHLVEPPDLWTSRLPSHLLEQGPRVERMPALSLPVYTDEGGQRDVLNVGPGDDHVWCDVWCFEGARYPLHRTAASKAFAPEDVVALPTTYDEIGSGCYEWSARLDDMDIAGVEASVTFPNLFVRFCGQRFIEARDKDLALKCVKAYNDFLFEEWSEPSGGRLLGSIILPLWDVDASTAELERNADRGCRSICFSEIPARLGLPSMYTQAWDPLLASCEAAGVVVSVHVGSSSTVPSTPGAPVTTGPINFFANTSLSLTDWVMSGTLARFPELKVAFSEGQAGWAPYLISRMDTEWHGGKANKHHITGLAEPPSSYMQGVHYCIFDDEIALQHLDVLGESNVCFETDYPHADGTFPHCREVALRNTSMLDHDQRVKVLRTNAMDLYRFEL